MKFLVLTLSVTFSISAFSQSNSYIDEVDSFNANTASQFEDYLRNNNSSEKSKLVKGMFSDFVSPHASFTSFCSTPEEDLHLLYSYSDPVNERPQAIGIDFSRPVYYSSTDNEYVEIFYYPVYNCFKSHSAVVGKLYIEYSVGNELQIQKMGLVDNNLSTHEFSIKFD